MRRGLLSLVVSWAVRLDRQDKNRRTCSGLGNCTRGQARQDTPHAQRTRETSATRGVEADSGQARHAFATVRLASATATISDAPESAAVKQQKSLTLRLGVLVSIRAPEKV